MKKLSICFVCIAIVMAFMVPMASFAQGKSPSPYPHCAYSGLRPATRQLLQSIDQNLPRVVRATERRLHRLKEDYAMPNIRTNSCFSLRPLQEAYQDEENTPSRRHLLHFCDKNLEIHPEPMQIIGIIVMEYDTEEAAAAAKTFQDSLVNNRTNYEKDDHSNYQRDYFVKRGNCLVRFCFFLLDPMARRTLREIRDALKL